MSPTAAADFDLTSPVETTLHHFFRHFEIVIFVIFQIDDNLLSALEILIYFHCYKVYDFLEGCSYHSYVSPFM